MCALPPLSRPTIHSLCSKCVNIYKLCRLYLRTGTVKRHYTASMNTYLYMCILTMLTCIFIYIYMFSLRCKIIWPDYGVYPRTYVTMMCAPVDIWDGLHKTSAMQPSNVTIAPLTQSQGQDPSSRIKDPRPDSAAASRLFAQSTHL
jgi:hypothetical protein